MSGKYTNGSEPSVSTYLLHDDKKTPRSDDTQSSESQPTSVSVNSCVTLCHEMPRCILISCAEAIS